MAKTTDSAVKATDRHDYFEEIGDKDKVLTGRDAAKGWRGDVALTKSEVVESCEQVAYQPFARRLALMSVTL